MIRFDNNGLTIEGEFSEESLLEYLNLMETERKRHQETIDELTRRIRLLREWIGDTSSATSE